MPGPNDASEALAWIKHAMATGCYILDSHFLQRCKDRRYSVHDAKRIAITATHCEPYPDFEPIAGGTSWRLYGQDCDGDPANLGVEAYKDHLGKWVIVITIMSG